MRFYWNVRFNNLPRRLFHLVADYEDLGICYRRHAYNTQIEASKGNVNRSSTLWRGFGKRSMTPITYTNYYVVRRLAGTPR